MVAVAHTDTSCHDGADAGSVALAVTGPAEADLVHLKEVVDSCPFVVVVDQSTAYSVAFGRCLVAEEPEWVPGIVDRLARTASVGSLVTASEDAEWADMCCQPVGRTEPVAFVGYLHGLVADIGILAVQPKCTFASDYADRKCCGDGKFLGRQNCMDRMVKYQQVLV